MIDIKLEQDYKIQGALQKGNQNILYDASVRVESSERGSRSHGDDSYVVIIIKIWVFGKGYRDGQPHTEKRY